MRKILVIGALAALLTGAEWTFWATSAEAG
jgi:hypothetical protein